ncbi:hypothetical protein [Mucilaginibacter lappiensis]|uniref:Osmotically-inducible protein OsmY n=1 Tax=Mucilaginibacter lappiensis TaxID=354630 RepID=A0A1N7GDA3_9SPHI|nr:hypothetical protein [Mucilaginibacter lappiensis]MBB6113014.1 osmotically-inducible protein OsmY [Mucilaginibacter lappiensis]MBB6127493.1 osmotically-inducible protein OsmY [Mucilaginibacter lappiensis]SIS10595.1 hypothetical protein SAMN05421821_12634 [Mucilaginibacter lappiensis]
MKSTIIALLLLLAGSTVCLAQCDKKLRLVTSKTEHLDASGNLERTEDEQTVIEIIDKKISVNIENGKQTLTGTIKSNTCNWTTPFKEGKSVINTTISDEDGNGEKEYTLTIEGKDGKVTLTAESPQMPDHKLRFVLDKFEEKK